MSKKYANDPFSEFITAAQESLNQTDIQFNTELRTSENAADVEARNFAGMVWGAAVEALNGMTAYDSNRMFDETFEIVQGQEQRVSAETGKVGQIVTLRPKLEALMDKAKVPTEYRYETLVALGQLLHKYAHASSTVMTNHWKSSGTAGKESASQLYGPEAPLSGSFFYENNGQIDVFNTPVVAGQEMFGQHSGMMLPDVRAAMAITLLRPQRSVTERIFHKKAINQPNVSYKIIYDEIFDLTKASDNDGAVRNNYGHRIPAISLIRNPEQVTYTPIRVVPKKANDTPGDFLVADGIIKFGVEADLFSLALEDKLMSSKVDHTSNLSPNVFLDKLYVTLKDGTNPDEEYIIDLTGNPRHRLLMAPQPEEPGIRQTQMRFVAPFTKLTKQGDGKGADTKIFEAIDDPNKLQMVVNISARINLRSAEMFATATPRFEAKTIVANTEPSAEAKALADKLNTGTNMVITGFSVDARYSEENLRNTTIITRTMGTTLDYEIPTTRTTIHDYALDDAQPENVLETFSNLHSNQCDHRNIQLIMKLMERIGVACVQEERDESYRANSNNQTLNMAYAAGNKINPYGIIRNIELFDTIDMIRSSDLYGDIRQYMDSLLNKLVSELHMKSLLNVQLPEGAIPSYKLITSTFILENVIAIPHIHQHMQNAGGQAEPLYTVNTNGEYVRKLPSGAELHCSIYPPKYMDDQIIIIPYLPRHPDSECNFALNFDMGDFTAHYIPTIQNAATKRVIANSRNYPVPTNPCFIWLTIADLAKLKPDTTAK